jgi:predicted alpha/beta superfamily hydrolase
MMRSIAIVLSLSMATAAMAADAFVLDRVEQQSLVSRENGVAYKLYVALPESYAAGAKRYPVVYLLDADYSFLIARNIGDHLAQRGDLSEVIFVGIAYGGPLQYRINRTRDYTPRFVPTGGYGPDVQKFSGGGPKFRAFIEKELIPFIDGQYRTIAGDRCLVGHSYGGLFAAWTLLSEPPLFRRYVIVSPSLWYDNRWMFSVLKRFAETHDSLDARVYMAVGSREGGADRQMVGDLREFLSTLRKRKSRGLAVGGSVLDDETHNSLFPRALSNGLRFVFEGR